MARAIAIMNQKGGVGKTTTTLNLGAALAHRGKRVLLIDLDPQANLTLGLGKYANDLSESVYELLTDAKTDAAKLVMHTAWERLDLLPSHIDLSGAELEMVTMMGRETRLTKALEPLRKEYDYILIDCLPSLSLLTVNAMVAVGEVIVPLQAHPFALVGLGKLFEVVGMVREAMNPALRVSGVLVTMFDGRTNVSKVTLDSLRHDERLREHIFSTTVKQNIKVAESQKEGVPVVHFDAACHAAKAYLALCDEVIEMETGCKASECAARITAREEASGDGRRTFTQDLLAPSTERGVGGRGSGVSEVVPARREETNSETTARSGDGETVATAGQEDGGTGGRVETASTEVVTDNRLPTTDNPSVEPVAVEVVTAVEVPEPPVLTQTWKDPPAETLEPVVAGPQTEIMNGEENAPASPGIEDEFYRPRLALKPGSCKVPLPPM